MSDRRKSPVEPEETEPQMCTFDVRMEVLTQVPFFSGLPEAEIARINEIFVESGFLPGETIYYEGEHASRLYVVAAGKVKLLRHSMTGKDVLLDILDKGEFFGSLTSLGDVLYSETAQAQTAVCVLSIDSEDFRQILDMVPAVALQVLDKVAERLRSAQEMVRQLSVHSVERRIAYILLMLGDKLGKPQEELGLLIDVPLSRDDLAEMTGTSTETASRVLSQFQREGWIQSGRQWIAIMDRDGLQGLIE